MLFKSYIKPICLTLVLAFTSSPLLATWQPAVVVSNPLIPASTLGGPVLNVNSEGNAVAVWTDLFTPTFPDEFAISSSFYTRGVGWSPPQVISSLALNAFDNPLYILQGDPDVDMNASNYAVAVWEGIFANGDDDPDMIFSSIKQPNGIWSPVQNVSVANTDLRQANANVALNDSGTAIAAWRAEDNNEGDAFILTSFLPFGGSWQPPVNISLNEEAYGVNSDNKPYVVINSDGDVAIIWFARFPGNIWAIVAATYDATTTTWSLPITLDSIAGDDAAFGRNPRIAIDENGNAVAIWGKLLETKTAFFTFGSGWGPSQTLASNSDSESQNVIMDALGNATAMWVSNVDAGGEVFSAFKPIIGGWGAPVVISQGTGNSSEPFMSQEPLDAEDGGSNIMAVWENGDGILVSAYRIFNQPWQEPEIVFNQNGIIYESVGLASCGFAIALWRYSNDTIMAAVNENFLAPFGELRIRECTLSFAMQKTRVTLFDWEPIFPPECILSFNIYCNEDLIAEVPGTSTSFSFTKGCRRCDYTLTTTNMFGFESDPVPFVFQ